MTDAFRFNPNHVPAGSSTGGQFGSAGGQTAQEKLAAEKEPPSSHGSARYGKTWRNGVMSYDPKGNIGPGYGSPNGDPDVHKLQAALNRLGLTDNRGKPLKLDGKLGPLTTQAIKSAQKALGMPTDGKVTRELFDKLTNLKSLPAAEKPAKKAVKVKARDDSWSELRESPLPHPGSAEKLHEYWVHGEGAARIGWGAPGDFDRCTHQLEEHAHFTPEQAHGYCNLAHHAATGMWPAQHAELVKGHRAMTQPMTDDELEAHLQQLLAGLSDEDISEIAALAEAMHADGGN